ncbi:MAG: tRNA pseudouridine(38-40) synthase TruA [Eubacteriales bacterium]|nr:tRNA pseudouridine(38-40) synthase TruA [Eubacteriales bacterium]MDD3199159.1 tRNA pseudouridine(38-40) synthase TruA [Eubacteriales bacterium]MDD4122474.1 tRNA pseudouridine(38-40) synthase TruA [Eubacteriales bacterium]MDD4629186.1 tRNA pseudouridine(38-40) synthase TruA [Eubacteriales bacterium]
MKNVLLTIAYDGTGFCGWQIQPDQRSVQGEVERVLSTICARPIRVNGTSRTDAGVHAYGQRASFLADFSIPVDKIPVAANGLLAAASDNNGRNRKNTADVVILSAEEVPLDFHARFNAVGKKYIYKIRNAQTPDPFQRNFFYSISRLLNVEAMEHAAAHFIGTYDFITFQAAGGKKLESTVRTIYSAKIHAARTPDLTENPDATPNAVILEITGDGFLYNMVRIIAGTLVDVGLNKIKPDKIPDLIAGESRQLAGHTAPPQGLYLAEVFYKKEKMYEATETIQAEC